MKKRFLTVVAIVMCVFAFGAINVCAQTVDSGACGENLTWSFDDNGTLTISGTGDMDNYENGTETPWEYYRYENMIKNIIIQDGVTSIGDWAFWYCLRTGNISFTIPNSVTYIGINAFSDCTALTDITIPNSVKNIGSDAFYACTGLTSITIPESVTTITTYAFEGCIGLTSVIIPKEVTTIEHDAFLDCDAITTVYYSGTESQWDKITVDSGNQCLTGANIICTGVREYYTINSLTIKDMSANVLREIPKSKFLATVSFTNVDATKDAVIVLAQYSQEGEFWGLMYVSTEDIPKGATIKLSIPVDNTKGETAQLKAFCWESFASAKPMGSAVTYPAQ